MDEEFIRNRITELRIEKNISEYKMSFDLGHSKGYIQSISSGRALPSLSELLYICDYFEITPAEFFDDTNKNVLKYNELNKEIKKLSNRDLDLLMQIIKRLQKS